MKKPVAGLMYALLLTPLAAAAAEGGYLDLMYTIEPKLEISDSSGSITFDSGSGLGLRGRAPFADGLFLQGEYVANDYEEVEGFAFDAEATMLRGGVGVKSPDSPLYGMLEFVTQEIDLVDANPPQSFDDSGYALSVGLQSESGGTNTLYAQIGYVDIGDFGDGFEYMVGGAFGIGPSAAILVDYRRSATEDDSGAEGELKDLRLGLRLHFGR